MDVCQALAGLWASVGISEPESGGSRTAAGHGRPGGAQKQTAGAAVQRGRGARSLDGDQSVFGDTGAPCRAAVLVGSEQYHCPDCDCLEPDGAPDLNPSAAALTTRDGQLGLYCLSCHLLWVVKVRVDYGGIGADGSDVVVDATPKRPYLRAAVMARALTNRAGVAAHEKGATNVRQEQK